MHRDTHVTNLRNLNLTTPGESDGFCVNRQRLAVPLSISGGQIAVIEVQRRRYMFYLTLKAQCVKFLRKPVWVNWAGNQCCSPITEQQRALCQWQWCHCAALE